MSTVAIKKDIELLLQNNQETTLFLEYNKETLLEAYKQLFLLDDSSSTLSCASTIFQILRQVLVKQPVLKIKNLQLSYEWNSQDSLLVNTTADLSFVLKKNGHLSLGKLLSDLKRLDEGVSGDLFGAWIISGNYSNDVVSRRANPFLPRRTMKIISGKHFQWVSYNVVTRKFFDAGGGTQSSVNGKYVENIEYFTKTAQSVGKSVEFSYSVLEGDWRHKGQKSTGGPLDECWTKRALIEEKSAKK